MQANTSVLLSVSLLSLLAGYYLAKWSTNAASRHPSALQQLEIVKDNTPPDSSGLIVVTRIHVAEAQALTAVDKVTTMVRDSLKYSSKVMICLGAKSVETRGLYLSELNSKLQKEGIESPIYSTPLHSLPFLSLPIPSFPFLSLPFPSIHCRVLTHHCCYHTLCSVQF